MDKLIRWVNADARVHAFYSTPAAYVAAKHSYNATWPLKRDDFFPYADIPHGYWTGYFTSRPASKGYIRSATAFLQAARQLEAAVAGAGSRSRSSPGGASAGGAGGATTDALEEAISIAQHHDAITGTARQHVANDYHRRIAGGMEQAKEVVTRALSALLGGGAGAGDGLAAARRLHQRQPRLGSEQGDEGSRGAAAPPSPGVALQVCDWLNVSSCAPTVELSRRGRAILAVAYNPLGWRRVTPVRVPLDTSTDCSWRVLGEPPAQRRLPGAGKCAPRFPFSGAGW